MVEPTRPPPTAEELEELNDAFRRDPVRAFVPLGEALLALGRPRDAVEVGARGLKADPGQYTGRLMVARAFALLHQWKEAQAELLKIVKADRNHGAAFRLLGEVLMRRADYERALPVLQHAQNLNPADPSILSLLRRARSGQPLDAPPPIPSPVDPAPARAGGGRGGRAGGPPGPPPAPRRPGRDAPVGGDTGSFPLDDLPTKVAGEIDTQNPTGPGAAQPGEWGDPAALGRMRLERVEVRRDAQRGAVEGSVRRRDGRAQDDVAQRPVEVHQPPPREDPFAPLGGPDGPGAGHAGFPGGAPPMAQTIPPGVRPRVMSVEKPKDAAQAALRQSAAAGEHYLNNLLTAGLLDIPRVRVREASFDLAPGKRWGRSAARMFVYLFVLMFLATGGAGAWYWFAEKQKDEDVARHLEGARGAVDVGEYQALVDADEQIRAAVERDRDNAVAVALLAEVSALESLLYGEVHPADARKAIELASQDITEPGQEGYRELVVAGAAHTLSALPTLEDGADAQLAEARRRLEKWLEGHAGDLLARWLHGRTLLAAGDRRGAIAAFEQADKGGDGPVLATIALADMRLDEGKYEEARALYDRALKKAPAQSWAFVGRSLSRAERSVEIAEAVGDLNVGVSQKRGPRVEAYKRLALASAHLAQEDYEAFGRELDLAVGVVEPRFLIRVGLLRLQQGRVADAARARSEVRWYADKPQPDPLLRAFDAELRLASGLLRDAFAAVEKEEGLRARTLRGRALFDMGKGKEALEELSAALEVAPGSLELQVWVEAARLLVSGGDERKKAEEALDSLGRKAKSKAARVPQGLALLRLGKRAAAQEKLALSLKDISAEYPNPLAYRAHVALAEIDLSDGKPETAAAHIEKALELNPGYLPAHDLLGRLLIDTAPDKALPHLVEVVKNEIASVGAELAFARAMAGSNSATDKAAAADAVRRARQKGASTEQLQLVIPMINPALYAELGVPEPRK